MGYIVKVNGMVEKLCRSSNEAKAYALLHNGKVYKLRKAKLPKAAMLSYNSPKALKGELFREIYSENNHGYHFIERKERY